MMGCNMAKKVKEIKALVKCEKCGKEVKHLKQHDLTAHGALSVTTLTAKVADLTAKLADSETKIKELSVANTPASVPAPSPAILSDVDKKAMFEDWVDNSLTFEAWQTIGEFKGWITPTPAVVNDFEQDTSKTSYQQVVLLRR